MKKIEPYCPPVCVLCKKEKPGMAVLESGHVCDECCENTRLGRDNTSRLVKAKQRADEIQLDQIKGKDFYNKSPEEIDYTIAAGHLMAQDINEILPEPVLSSGGEVANCKNTLLNTLQNPTIVALEASNHRTDLVTMLGNDIAALALDTATTLQAKNSVEQMLAHQMAAIHDSAMRMINRSNLAQDATLATKTLNVALKGFAVYQNAINTFQQLHGNQQQVVAVQQVNVNSGAQAVVNNVNAGGNLS